MRFALGIVIIFVGVIGSYLLACWVVIPLDDEPAPTTELKDETGTGTIVWEHELKKEPKQ